MMRKAFSLITALFILTCPLFAQATILFGEENGHTLHRDPFCKSRWLSTPNPFACVFDYENAQAVYNSGEWLVCSDCYLDFFTDSEERIPESFSNIWNASLEEKALMLPGVCGHCQQNRPFRLKKRIKRQRKVLQQILSFRVI